MKNDRLFTGKTVLVTGATAGIGLHAAKAFACEGAFVIGVGRSEERCERATEVIEEACPGACFRFLLANLSLQSQVRDLASQVKEILMQEGILALDTLVNNAGGYWGELLRTSEGFEMTLAVNHLAPFLLTHELLSLLKRSRMGRVLMVSSNSHRRTRLNIRRLNNPLIHFGLSAYKRTKLANVLFTQALDRRLKGTNARAFAVDPGLVQTEIGFKGTSGLEHLVWHNRRNRGAHPDVPARTILYLAGEPSLQDSDEIYWHNCAPRRVDPRALDEKLAEALWAASCEMCGIKEYGGGS